MQPTDQPTATNDDVPDHCRCPITQRAFQNPVLTEDGFSYEYDAIYKWLFEMGKNTSPITRLPLGSKILVENKTLRHEVSRELEIRQLAPPVSHHQSLDIKSVEEDIAAFESCIEAEDSEIARLKWKKYHDNPRNLDASRLYCQAVECYCSGSNLEEALRLLEDSLTLRPFHLKTMLLKATILSQLGEFDLAINELVLCQHHFPGNEEISRHIDLLMHMTPPAGSVIEAESQSVPPSYLLFSPSFCQTLQDHP